MLEILNKFFDFCGEKNKKRFHASIVLGVIMALCEAMKIPAIVLLLDAAIKGNITSSTIWMSFGICLFSIVIGASIRYFSVMMQCEAGYGTTADKRIEIAEHLRYLPMGYFNDNSLGYITSVTTNTMEQLGDVATRVVMMTTQGVLTASVITIMLLIYDWRIGLITAFGMALFFVVNSFLQKKSEAVSPLKSASDSKLVSELLEYIQGMTEVKTYDLTGDTCKKLNSAIDNNRDVNIKLEKVFVPFIAIQSLVTKGTGVIMTLASIWLYLSGSMELIVCINMMICAFIVYASLDSAGNYSALLRTVDNAVDKANAILALEPMDINGSDMAPARCDIDLDNVTFSYEKRSIINGVSLHIPHNTTTAIVGPSGGGKTTLCSLISRFWDVDSGKVMLGGKNVKEYSMDSLMKNFSFVFQNVYLFRDTIANNIRFGEPDAPIEKVIEAAKKACCHDFIMSLPNGYDTIIGEGGASLSGGEKQRISIARAMMKDSPIIILDEATANVDPENEKDLVNAINELTKEKTIIMIAHRLKTVRNADQIIVIDHGNIVQQGKHDELMKADGIYKRFVAAREAAAGWKL